VVLPWEFLGTAYGGFGAVLDGVGPQSIVYSFGVGEDVSFDVALIQRTGASVFAFDPTPRAGAWVASQALPPQFRFFPYGIATYDGTARFFPPIDPAHVSHSLLSSGFGANPIEVDVRQISTLSAMLGHRRIDLLKMDIEGAEYDVLDDVLACGLPVHQILVEFHDRLPGLGPEKTSGIIRNLQEHGYRIFWISEGRCEYGFIRRPRWWMPVRWLDWMTRRSRTHA